MIKLFEGNIADVSRCDNPVSIRYPQLPSIPDLQPLQSRKQGIHSTEQKRQTHLCQLAEVLGHRNQKAQPSSSLPESKYEYLSVALPECPAHPIRIYGTAVHADMRYLMRAELILSISVGFPIGWHVRLQLLSKMLSMLF